MDQKVTRKAPRDRLTRQPLGLHAKASDNDVFLEPLQRWPLLPRSFVDAINPPSSKWYRSDRYETLFHELGFIERSRELARSTKNARSKQQSIKLTEEGRRFLDSRNLRKTTHVRTDADNHCATCSMVGASLEIGIKARPGLFLIDHEEILNFAPKETWESARPFDFLVDYEYPIPNSHKTERVNHYVEHDLLPLGIGYRRPDGKTGKIFFPAIEVQRATEGLHPKDSKRQSVMHKLQSLIYLLDNDIYQKQLGIKNATALYIDVSHHALLNAMETVRRITNGHGHEHIAFKLVPDIKYSDFPPADGHMLTEPWQRVGYPPLDILQELGYPKRGE